MNTDIIISSRFTREFPAEDYLKACIESVNKHTHGFRIILVDDNSDDIGREAISFLAASNPHSLLLRTHFQRWFTRAYNLGLSLVRTPYAAMLNCDVTVDTGWLEELYAVKDEVEAQGRVGLVGSHYSGEEPRRYQVSNMPDYVTGHGVLFNMEALRECASSRGTPGVFLDETQPRNIHIRSDVEICWDMNRLGWQCVKSFKSAIGHHGAKCWGQQLGRIPSSVDTVNERYS